MFKNICLVLSVFTSLALISFAVGQDAARVVENDIAPSDAYDCTTVTLNSVDDANLTTAERIAQMDANLLDSIDKHDSCIDQVVSSNAASGSGAGLAGGGADDASGESAAGESVGSENTGGDSATTSNSSEGISSNSPESIAEQASSQDDTNKTSDKGPHRGVQVTGNGAKNQDVSAVDNDSAVCRLLKDELKIETDSKKQADLKDIYNSYRCRG